MNQKTALISIIGKPNAGKSTLLNRIIGQKISIVTRKAQTTRSMIRGILTENDSQLIFVDTPGIFEAKKKLDKAMVRAAWSSVAGADFVLIMIDAVYGIEEELAKFLQKVKSQQIRPIIIFNKADLVSEEKIQELKYIISEKFGSIETFSLSALKGDGCQDMISYLQDNAPIHPWHYGEDEITTAPMRFLASEITREQLFLNLHDELPYNLMVETEQWEEFRDGSVKINQVIYVARDMHKIIVLGKDGATIKKISENSRRNIGEALDLKIHLFLFVKVREDWEKRQINLL
jgi:GTP-binding protein Era